MGKTYLSRDGSEATLCVAPAPSDSSAFSETTVDTRVVMQDRGPEPSLPVWPAGAACWDDSDLACGEGGLCCCRVLAGVGAAGESNRLRFTGFSDTNWTSSSQRLREVWGLAATEVGNRGELGSSEVTPALAAAKAVHGTDVDGGGSGNDGAVGGGGCGAEECDGREDVRDV